MTAAFAPSSFKKKGSSIAASSEESISEDLPFSDAPSRNSSISEHLPSDLSFHSKKNKPKPKKTDTDAYENESFYSADSDFESDSSSTTPTGDMEDLAIINQLLKTATKKLNSKTLTKKEKLINSTLKAVENLKENGDLDRKLNLESLRISKMLEDLIKGASVAAGALDSHSPVTADDVASDREIVATARKEIETKNTLKFIEAQLDNLKNDLNSYQEDLLDFGKGDSPKKKALQMASTSLPWPSFALPPAATPTVLLETPQNAVTDNSVSASDGKSSLFLNSINDSVSLSFCRNDHQVGCPNIKNAERNRCKKICHEHGQKVGKGHYYSKAVECSIRSWPRTAISESSRAIIRHWSSFRRPGCC